MSGSPHPAIGCTSSGDEIGDVSNCHAAEGATNKDMN